MQRGSLAVWLLLFVAILLILGGIYFFTDNFRVVNDLPKEETLKPEEVLREQIVDEGQFIDKALAQETKISHEKEIKNEVYKDEEIGILFEMPDQSLKLIGDTEESYFNRSGGDLRKNFTGYVGYVPPRFLKGLIVNIEEPQKAFDLVTFTLWVFENPDNLDPLLWYDKFWYYPFVWGDFANNSKNVVSPQGKVVIDGRIAGYNTVSYRPGSPKFYYLAYNQKMYLFQVIDGEEKYGEKILGSVKFLN